MPCVCVYSGVCVLSLSFSWNSPVPPSESHGGITRKRKVHFCILTRHYTAINTGRLSRLKILHQKAFESFIFVRDCVCLCESARASISACEQVITGYKLSASAQKRHVNPHGSVQNRTHEV